MTLYKQGEWDHVSIKKSGKNIHLFFDKAGNRLPKGSRIEIVSFGAVATTFDQNVIDVFAEQIEQDGKAILKHTAIVEI